MRERTIWISAGVLGLAVAIALAVLTSHVSQPPVGVPGEPVSAGKQLAPARTDDGPAAAAPERLGTRTTTTATAPPAAGRPAPRDDDVGERDSSGPGSGDGDGGRGRGRGRGRGGDD